MKKHYYVAVMGVLTISWAYYSLHFYNLLEPYASSGRHTRNPVLYVATETWGIICLFIASILAEKTLSAAFKN